LVVFSVLLILTAAEGGSAESPSTQPSDLVLSSLADYLDYAQDHNLQLQRAMVRLKGVLGRVPKAGRMPNPKVTYGDSLEEVQLLHTNLTPQRNTFGLTQTIPWFGKRSIEKNSMSLQARAEWKRYEVESLKIFHEVRVAFYEYAHLPSSQ
jgi:outer membrane protein TolC